MISFMNHDAFFIYRYKIAHTTPYDTKVDDTYFNFRTQH